LIDGAKLELERFVEHVDDLLLAFHAASPPGWSFLRTILIGMKVLSYDTCAPWTISHAVLARNAKYYLPQSIVRSRISPWPEYVRALKYARSRWNGGWCLLRYAGLGKA
jgi:hypothetical protein